MMNRDDLSKSTKTLLVLASLITMPILNSCASEVNTPIIGNTYDSTTTTEPYQYQGQSLEDCDILTKEQRKESKGCVDYETINRVDGRE